MRLLRLQRNRSNDGEIYKGTSWNVSDFDLSKKYYIFQRYIVLLVVYPCPASRTSFSTQATHTVTACRADVEQVPTWSSKAERVREAFLEERKDRMQYPEPIAKLIESYMKLPGIGQKTATRLAFLQLI